MKMKMVKRLWDHSQQPTFGISPREILECVTDAFYAVDADWRLTHINTTTEKWWHRRREELLGTGLWDMLPESEKTIGWQMHHRAMLDRVPVHWETFSPNLKVWVDANAYPTSDGGIAVYFRDITGRKQDEEALRESEKRQAYLLMLSDTIRLLSDTNAIIDAASNLLVEHLGVSQTSYCEYGDANGFVRNENPGVAAQSPKMVDMLGEFPVTMAIVRSNGKMVVADLRSCTDLPEEERARWLALNCQAMICVPLIKEGKLLATLSVKQSTPRQWTPLEVELVSETARRIWKAVERARVEAALRESVETARQRAELLENLMEMVPVCILVSEDPYCSSIVGNRAANEMYESENGENVSAGTVNGEVINNERHWFKDDRELRPEELSMQVAVARGQDVLNYEADMLLPSGRLLTMFGNARPLFDDQGRVRGCLGVYMDITERKRIEKETLASERELLKVTMDSLGEGVVAIDQEAQIIFMNETAANLIGCRRNEAIGQPYEKVLYIFDDSTSEPLDIRIQAQTRSNPIMLTGDLCEVPIALNCSPIKATDGRIIGTVAVFQDISEKLKTQQELTKSDKLESLGILAGGIAHDFNNVLGAILSNVQLAMMKIEKNQDIVQYLSKTVETAHKASELTKQLLTFSKGGAPVRKDASLVDLIKDTAEFALRGAKTKVEFVISDNLWPASIDEGQISQMIQNLVINAEQAMPRGGVIRISAANIGLTTKPRFKPGNYVKITIQDQGIGIPQENLAKIFDPFFTTKKEGNGLGLSTAYSVIRHHDGYIEVESQVGVGTTFDVYLPASYGMPPPVAARREVAAFGFGFKILLMDDEKAILNAVGEMLERYGYQVVAVPDGDAAIDAYQKAKEAGEPFDAVILDLTVPGGKGGQAVVAYLRDVDPKIKAIISSGYANDPIMADFERYGFAGVVNKPYKIDELHEVLQKMLNPDQLSLGLRF